jgi:hypothetical protein
MNATLTVLLAVPALVLLAWLLYMLGNAGDYRTTPRTRFNRLYRRIVFWAGDVHRISHFPWVTWDVSEHLVEYEEALAALPHIQPGDVGLHREKGFLSNLAIPGFMKHAWLHLNGPERWTAPGGRERFDTDAMRIVEAVSEGVLKRSALYPIRSDYAIILRPRNVEPPSVRFALAKARRIVGCEYDVNFEFDIESELDHFESAGGPPADREARRRDLEVFGANLRAEFDGGFSCSEAVSFAWWHEKDRLNIFREKMRGKDVILPDRFLNRGFEIVWMSGSVTPELALGLGLPAEGVEMIRAYRAAHPATPRGAEPKRRGRFWRKLGRRFGVGPKGGVATPSRSDAGTRGRGELTTRRHGDAVTGPRPHHRASATGSGRKGSGA